MIAIQVSSFAGFPPLAHREPIQLNNPKQFAEPDRFGKVFIDTDLPGALCPPRWNTRDDDDLHVANDSFSRIRRANS